MHRIPGGLRFRLVVAFALVTTLILAGTFYGLHQGTGADLRKRLDEDLQEQYNEYRNQVLARTDSVAELASASDAWVHEQRYNPRSRILLVQIPGVGDFTNQTQVVRREEEREAGEDESADRGDSTRKEASVIDSPPGIRTVHTGDAGRVRVLSQPIVVDGRSVGTFRIADPITSIEQAQAGLRGTFVVVGLAALGVAILAAILLASLITRPLRRMAGVASDVDAGDLTHRMHYEGGGNEIEVLADSFDRMLDRLEQAFRRQRDFVSDASHELRTPLTVLRGQIELLGREPADSPERTIQTVLAEIDRMNRLVDDMLMLARTEEGSFLQKRPVDLEDFFADLERDLPLFGERKYQVTSPPRGGVVGADPDRISQVLRNLIKNAVAHTDADGKISVGAQPHDRYIEFYVSDDGPGIPPDQLDVVFDRFHRVDEGRARDEGGSGLGLAIARAIVEAHGGRIWAESPPGRGATFRFDLPSYRAA